MACLKKIALAAAQRVDSGGKDGSLGKHVTRRADDASSRLGPNLKAGED